LSADFDAKPEARIVRHRLSLVALMVERIILLAAGARADSEFAVGNRLKIPAVRNSLLKQGAFDDMFEPVAPGIQRGAATMLVYQLGELLALGGTGLAEYGSEPAAG
jgi:hypothetical protein